MNFGPPAASRIRVYAPADLSVLHNGTLPGLRQVWRAAESAGRLTSKLSIGQTLLRNWGSRRMSMLVRLIGAFLLTYFASRFTRRLLVGPGRSSGLLYAHGLALGIALLAVAAIKLPYGQFTLQTLGGLLAGQLFWLTLDGARKQLGTEHKPR